MRPTLIYLRLGLALLRRVGGRGLVDDQTNNRLGRFLWDGVALGTGNQPWVRYGTYL